MFTAAARNPLGASERRDADANDGRRGGVAAHDGYARFGDPFVERKHVVELGLAGEGETDEQAFGHRPGRGEVADVHRSSAEAELAPGEPVEPEVHPFDERVLRDHEPADDGRVVLDADDHPAPLELGEKRELTRLRERRQRPSSRPDRSRRG